MSNVKKLLSTAVVSAGLLAGTSTPALAYNHYQSNYHYYKHKRHMKTLKRVGIGAGGGAVVGGLIGGGAGAGIGALAGGGAGYLYDRNRKHHGHY
jgi:hypothetical protein